MIPTREKGETESAPPRGPLPFNESDGSITEHNGPHPTRPFGEPQLADPAAGPSGLATRLWASGPKRILALDGGGVRGVITLGYLARIESILRERSGNNHFVLADYFDLIGGTSTGAIIATALSLGWPVERIRSMYLGLARDVFRPKKTVMGPLVRLMGAKFDERPLERVLRAELGDMRLDAPEIRTGLVIVAKRADTASVWQLTNIPGHRFYGMNRHLKVWEALRASTAAPTYFAPQRIDDVGHGEPAVFVDGAVSMHGNPALQMLMVANLKGFGLEWELGEDAVFLCSLGTGSYDVAPGSDSIQGFRQIQWLGTLMTQLMRDSSHLGETLLQWMSRSPRARSIDRQIGTLEGDLLGGRALLTYFRFNTHLSPEGLAELGLEWSPAEVAALRDMTNARFIDDLAELGQRHSSAILGSDLPPHFDPFYKSAVR